MAFLDNQVSIGRTEFKVFQTKTAKNWECFLIEYDGKNEPVVTDAYEFVFEKSD